MILNYQYRAYPDTCQKLTLNHWRRICQYWYNRQLGERFDWYAINRNDYITPSGEFSLRYCTLPPFELKDNPNYYSQKKELPKLKKDLITVEHSGEILDFTEPPSQTLQEVCKRVKKAFDRYIKGDSKGTRSGKPRFKNTARYRTLHIEGQGVTIEKVRRKWLFISISKLKGWMKIRLHRPLPERFELKNLLLTKKADGWYCTFTIEDKSVPVFNPDDIKATWDNSLGLDAVLHEDNYLATSEGVKLPSLKSFRRNQDKLALVSKRKSSKRKGSRSRRKLAKRESRIHQRIARARKDHAYKTAHELLKTNKKVFFIEDLNIKSLTKRNKAKKDESGKYLPNGQSSKSGLNKSWLDAAFGRTRSRNLFRLVRCPHNFLLFSTT